MPVVAQARERYLRWPRLHPRAGGATLEVIAWEADGERILRFPLAADGTAMGEPDRGPVQRAIPSYDDATSDDAHADGGYAVRVVRDGGVSEVRLTAPDGREHLVFRAPAIAAAPCVAEAEDGAFVAFHHDLREDRGTPDVAKWIAVRFVTRDGRVLEPADEMRDRDRDRAGEEQSFEMPALVVGEDGAVAIYGRGSHNFWRQDLSAGGWTERRPLGEGPWGCRGRRVAVLPLGDGALLTARREREGIVVERHEMPRGGAPALSPAQVAPAVTGEVRIEHVRAADDPARVDGRRTLFGDIHQHSAHSDGIGTADEAYERARHRYGDDFCALTDHESFLGKRIGPGEWAWLEAAAARHDDPGRFATIFAYEWTARMYPGPGHKVVYYESAGLPVISRDDVPEGKDLVARVRDLGGIAVPHHVGWTGADAEAHDPFVQPVWEICSCHGCYEHADHPLGQRGELRDQLADVMLKRGLKFGFIACSDSHGLLFHHGVARKRDPFRTGLTAVQAKDVTRAAILEAIRERRCYATSGAKILLDLRAGDRPMGSEIPRSGAPLSVRATAIGTAPIERIELVGPEGVIAQAAPRTERAELAARVSSAYAYARVTQSDGEMAWSSPVFSV